MGQNFSWLKQVGHEFEQQQLAGNHRHAVRRICVKIECRWFCMPIKGQSKTTKTRFCLLIHKNFSYLEKELGRILNQEIIRSPIIPVSKKLINLLRHGSLPREDDGAIEFWRIKDDLQTYFLYCHHWSDAKWKNSMARGGGNKNIYQYCTDSSGAILYLRALQGRSGRSLVDPNLQDNVVIPDGFFKYIYHVGSAIINSDLIPGGQNFEQQTDSILSACGSHGQKP